MSALFFVYRPTASRAWDIPGVSDTVRYAVWTRGIHRITAVLVTWTALVVALMLFIERGRFRWSWRSLRMGIGLVLATAATGITGYLLPWDQLALWAVTVGTNYSGYRPLFGDQVKFVLINGTEIAPSTLVRWLLVHMLLLGPAVVGFTLVLLRRYRRDFGEIEPDHSDNAASDLEGRRG